MGGGALGALIEDFDWSATGVGPLDAWPQANAPHGRELQSPWLVTCWPVGGMIYNAPLAFAGERHPVAVPM